MPARITFSTVNLRFNRNLLPLFQMRNRFPSLYNLSTYFMSLCDRISRKRMGPVIYVYVRAAYSHTSNQDQNITFTRDGNIFCTKLYFPRGHHYFLQHISIMYHKFLFSLHLLFSNKFEFQRSLLPEVRWFL